MFYFNISEHYTFIPLCIQGQALTFLWLTNALYQPRSMFGKGELRKAIYSLNWNMNYKGICICSNNIKMQKWKVTSCQSTNKQDITRHKQKHKGILHTLCPKSCIYFILDMNRKFSFEIFSFLTISINAGFFRLIDQIS